MNPRFRTDRGRLGALVRWSLLPAALVACFTIAWPAAVGDLRVREASADGPAVISLDMDPSTPGIQDTISYPVDTAQIQVDVVVENANAIGAFEFWLAYDYIYMHFDGWQVGPFLGSTGRLVQCQQIITENTIRIGCTSLGPPPPDGPSGDGVLARLFFSPRFGGETCISVLLVETAEVFGHALPTISNDGCVTFIPNTATPTSTATPTGTATHAATITAVPTQTAVATRTAFPTSTRTVYPSTTVTTKTSTAVATTTFGPTTTTPVGSPTRRSDQETPRSRTSTPSSQGTVSSGGETPSTPVNDVLGGPPSTTVRGFPRAGQNDGFVGSDMGWVVTAMSLAIGVLLALLVRQTFFSDRDD